jgi:hypothetical protein
MKIIETEVAMIKNTYPIKDVVNLLSPEELKKETRRRMVPTIKKILIRTVPAVLVFSDFMFIYAKEFFLHIFFCFVLVVVIVGYWLLNVVRFFDPCLQDGEVACACIVGETTEAKKHRFRFLRIRDRGKMKQIETVFSFSSA